jgi:hypothetical protein
VSACAGCGGPLTGQQRKWCSPECSKTSAREQRLAAIFNITPAEYDLILAEQGGGCAVCEKKPVGKFFPVDHDHRSSLLRGVLCAHCNLRVIGRHTDPHLLRRAADYLADPPARRALGRDVIAPGRPKRKRRSRRKKAAA